MLLYVTRQESVQSQAKSRLVLIGCQTTNDLLDKVENFCNTRQEWLIVSLKQGLANVFNGLSRSGLWGDGR
jgi:hypothetical protein